MRTDGVGPISSMYRDAVEARCGGGDRYEVALNLMVAERRLIGTIGDVLKEHGLTRPQWSVLTILHLAPTEQIPLGRIAQTLEVHGTTITNAVDRLVDLGLAERALDPNDRRSIFAQATPEGDRTSDAILRRLTELQFGLAALSENEVKTLSRILSKLSPLS
jgi:DNA-binding MarR family transcriptional regulator